METTRVIRGDARDLPLDDESVDLIITSPPYFALRSYRDDGEHYDGQVGSEATPQEFLEALWECTREWMRVLKPTGSIWVNLGDKYAGSGGHNNSAISAKSTLTGGLRKLQDEDSRTQPATRRDAPDRYNQNAGGIPAKSLMGLPWRYAIGCVDQLGLILRAEVVWSKPNGLPESVTDRVRRSHEQWFHFVKQGRYFAAVDEVREPYDPKSLAQYEARDGKGWRLAEERQVHNSVDSNRKVNPLGKLPGSVWTIPSEPLIIPEAVQAHYQLPDHFAAFPTEWPRRIILGWSPSGVCTACGEGRRPVVDKQYLSVGDKFAGGTAIAGRHDSGKRMGDGVEASIVGYACACTPYTDHPGCGDACGPSYSDSVAAGAYPTTHARAEWGSNSLQDRPKVGPTREYHLAGWTPPATTPAVVLDPFGGTGTVAMVARALGRVGISVDLSADYCRLAQWRIFQSGHADKAERRTWADRQESLL